MADEAPKNSGTGEPPKIKLNLTSFGKPKTGPKDTPMPVVPASATPKVETTRIDLAKAVPAADIKTVDPVDASKFTTMRVEIVETPRKSETTRIDLANATPKLANRVDISKEDVNADDLFKRNTIAVGVPTPGPTTRPKTIQVKRPSAQTSAPAITPGTPTAESVSEAKKSETARIDLPTEGSDRPVTRPKTIRIKRPDGTSGRKPLMIARPAEEGAEGAVVSTGFTDSSMGTIGTEEGPGVVFSILALVALLVACVVVYVLSAQTIGLTLPFPGRLV